MVKQRSRNRQGTTGQKENVQDVQKVNPNNLKSKQQEPKGQKKRRRGNAEDDAVPSFQVRFAAMPPNQAGDPNQDPDTDIDTVTDHNGFELNNCLYPDLVYTACPDVASVGNWDRASGQTFPTPPSSSLGAHAASHLSDAYFQGAHFVDTLPANSDDLRAVIFYNWGTMPRPHLSSQESSGFSAHEPTIPVCTSSSAYNWVEELPELHPTSSNQDYPFIS